MTMSKMANLIKAPHLGVDLIEAAAYDIVEHTRDLAPVLETTDETALQAHGLR